MIHYVDSLADWEAVRTGGVLDYAQELKAPGRDSAASACPATTRKWPWRR